MDYSTPDFPVRDQLSEPAQTHVHRVGDAIEVLVEVSIVKSTLESQNDSQPCNLTTCIETLHAFLEMCVLFWLQLYQGQLHNWSLKFCVILEEWVAVGYSTF